MLGARSLARCVEDSVAKKAEVRHRGCFRERSYNEMQVGVAQTRIEPGARFPGRL